MIAKTIPGVDFGAAVGYVLGKRDSTLLFKQRLGASDDPERIAGSMRLCAGKSRAKKAVYHLIVSWDRADHVGHDAMEEVAKRLLEKLGLEEHQAVVAAHGDCAHPHMHIVANRVHPRHGERGADGKKIHAWRAWGDGQIIQTELRAMERKYGWREVEGRLSLQIGHEVPGRAGRVKKAYHARKESGLPPVQRGRSREAAGMRLHHRKSSGGVPPDLPRTAKQLAGVWKAAGLGDAQCQWKMGKMFGIGIGVAHDWAIAAGWMQLAALQGHPLAKEDYELYTRWGGRPAVNPHLFGGEDRDGFVLGIRYSKRPKDWIGEWIGERIHTQEVGMERGG